MRGTHLDINLTLLPPSSSSSDGTSSSSSGGGGASLLGAAATADEQPPTPAGCAASTAAAAATSSAAAAGAASPSRVPVLNPGAPCGGGARVGVIFKSWRPGGRGAAVLSFEWASGCLFIDFDEPRPSAYDPHPEDTPGSRRVGGALASFAPGGRERDAAVMRSPLCVRARALHGPMHVWCGRRCLRACVQDCETALADACLVAACPLTCTGQHPTLTALCCSRPALRAALRLPRPPPPAPAGEPVSLRILLDGSACEVFTSSGESLTTRIYRGFPPLYGGSGGDAGHDGGSCSGDGGGCEQVPELAAAASAAAAGGEDETGIALYAAGAPVVLKAVDVWEMGACWEPSSSDAAAAAAAQPAAAAPATAAGAKPAPPRTPAAAGEQAHAHVHMAAGGQAHVADRFLDCLHIHQ